MDAYLLIKKCLTVKKKIHDIHANDQRVPKEEPR